MTKINWIELWCHDRYWYLKLFFPPSAVSGGLVDEGLLGQLLIKINDVKSLIEYMNHDIINILPITNQWIILWSSVPGCNREWDVILAHWQLWLLLPVIDVLGIKARLLQNCVLSIIIYCVLFAKLIGQSGVSITVTLGLVFDLDENHIIIILINQPYPDHLIVLLYLSSFSAPVLANQLNFHILWLILLWLVTNEN